jgi:hypothetical protein
MNHDSYDRDYLRGILDDVRTVAMVGASANPVRASFFVAKYMTEKGYRVIPVNPALAGREVLGEHGYAALADVPEPVDMIDIFRSSEAAGGIVDEALALAPLPKAIWMQFNVRDDAAAARAEARGVRVVMNRCPKVEWARLHGEMGWSGLNSGTISARRQTMVRK